MAGAKYIMIYKAVIGNYILEFVGICRRVLMSCMKDTYLLVCHI